MVDDPMASEKDGRCRERVVESPSNEAFKTLRQTLTGKGIRKEGKAVLAGPKFIAEVVDRRRDHCLAWITDARDTGTPPAGLECWRLARPLFDEIDVAGTGGPLLLVRVPEFAAWDASAPWPDGCTLFVPFQNPDNVGAVIRSAAAFGVRRVVLLEEAAHPFHPKAIRAAGPAVFQVELMTGPSIRELRSRDVPLYSLSGEGSPLGEAVFPARFGLVPGVEGPGLPEELRGQHCLSIPMAPGVESLNATVATAVALYEMTTRRGR